MIWGRNLFLFHSSFLAKMGSAWLGNIATEKEQLAPHEYTTFPATVCYNLYQLLLHHYEQNA
jgi:hypothetical protein